MHQLACLDIWVEIFKYFEIEACALSDDKDKENRVKRQTLASVASTCSKLRQPALDELWRCLNTLKPIVEALNSISPSGGILKYHLELWVIDLQVPQVPDFEALLDRILNRVRSIHLAGPNSKDLSLCHTLLCLGKSSVLFPQLQELYLSTDSFDQAHYIYPLFSPTLQKVSLTSYMNSGANTLAISLFVNTMKLRHIHLLHFSITGPFYPRIFDEIAEFTTLRSLAVRLSNISSYAVGLTGDPVSSFQKLQNLTKLEIDLKVLSGFATEAVGSWIATSTTLSDVCLRGGWDVIYPCLLSEGFSYPSVRQLTLALSYTSQAGPKHIFTDAFLPTPSNFPKINSISIRTENCPQNAWTAHINILNLLNMPDSVRSIDLYDVPIALTTEDILEFLIRRPMLQEFSVKPINALTPYDARTLFTGLHSHRVDLHKLGIPMDFSSLKGLRPSDVVLPSKCPIYRLTIMEKRGGIWSGDTWNLVHMLLRLFPNLTAVTCIRCNESVVNAVRTLNDQLCDLRELLSHPPSMDYS